MNIRRIDELFILDVHGEKIIDLTPKKIFLRILCKFSEKNFLSHGPAIASIQQQSRGTLLSTLNKTNSAPSGKMQI